MIYFHPRISNMLSEEKSNQLFGFVSHIEEGSNTIDKDIHTIDDETLNRFIKFYSDKRVENLEIYQKEEIRYILESMGDYNTNKLKNFLKHDPSSKEGEIYKLLSENLFDKQLMFLDEMLN